MTHPATVPGDITGVHFPTSVDAMQAAGTGFLTRAFRATGAIAPDNAVEEITHWKEFFGGGMGRKIAFDVRYTRAEPGLKHRLFAKFTREFGDPLREWFSPVMEPEVRFALMTRAEGFPLHVPACFFGDYCAAHLSGLLITERVPYGEGTVLPAMDKCLDYELDDPLPCYEAQAFAIGRLAAHHRTGGFGSEVERQFPFDREKMATTRIIPYTAEVLREKMALLRDFVRAAPQLLPALLREPAFLEAFARDAERVLEKETDILAHLAGEEDLITLCHWNMNPDNAWFWRDEQGHMHSGQLDWGGVSQMNLAQSFVGLLCSAETEFLDRHEDALLRIVLDTYHAHGGPRVDPARFQRSQTLATALLGIAWMIDAPTLIAAEIPDYAKLADRFDPEIRNRFIPRAQLQIMVIFLDRWRRLDAGRVVRELGAG